MRRPPFVTGWLPAVALALALVPGLGQQAAAQKDERLFDPLPLAPADFFLRGDSNTNYALEIGDPILTLSFLFLGGDPPACQKTADSNDDGVVNVSDPIALLNYLFVGGPSPHSPLRDCGVDLTEDPLSCTTYPPCSLDGLDTRWYRVRQNGTTCPPDKVPCFSWTATEVGSSGPVEVLISDLSLDYFYSESTLTEGQKAGIAAGILGGGLEAGGFLQDGPVGPAGTGRTLVVLFTRIFNDPLADLVVPVFEQSGPLSFPARGGVDVPLRVRVFNQGRGSTDRAFSVAIRQGKSTLATLGAAELPPQQGATFSKTLRLADSVIGTVVRLTATADPADEVHESDNANNARALSVPVPGGECEIFIDERGKPIKICP
ncbi:MAG: hypothetical protein HY721_06835 [Planctomycetes bacterium]|nr:hypothetical protein [Planctomycetota bacterium]